MPALALLIVSVAAGVGLLWIFARTSDQRAIRATKRALQARLLELRLYADDPKVVLRAQKALLALNARYLWLMLRPAAVATLPMVALLIALDGYYGNRPLKPGEATIVTAQMSAPLNGSAPPELVAPDGFAVETPAARVPVLRQVSWRVRAIHAGRGELKLLSGGVEVAKQIEAGSGLRFLTSRRVRAAASWLIHPGEARIDTGAVEWIEVDYPASRLACFGFEAHWLVWFLIFSMVTALLLKGKFKVTI